MNHISDRDPKVVRLSCDVYSLMLKGYPRSFYHQYAYSMAQLFRDCCLESYGKGLMPMLSFWIFALGDWCKSVIEQQLYGGTEMMNSKLFRLSGLALIGAGALFLLDIAVNTIQIRAGLYNMFGHPPMGAWFDPIFTLTEIMQFLPPLVALLLTVYGLMGLRARYAYDRDRPANMALGVGIFGGLAAVVFYLFEIVGFDGFFPLGRISIAVMLAALLVFGLYAVRFKLMPRGNFLPIIPGLWYPGYVIFVHVFMPFNENLHLPLFLFSWWSHAVLIISSICIPLILLGVVLRSEVGVQDVKVA